MFFVPVRGWMDGCLSQETEKPNADVLCLDEDVGIQSAIDGNSF